MDVNTRIAKNTLILYCRMLFSMIVTLYTSRIVLNTLGVEDFGIYSIVAGVVIMFGFLNNAMSASTQRFLTYESAKGNHSSLQNIFNVSITIHLIIAIIIFIIAETIGLWFLNTQLNIPLERMTAANWVFQFSIFSFVISVCLVPYNAVIIANEKMQAFAFIGLVEVILKLIVVFLLTIIEFDQLITYAALLCLVTIVVKVSEQVYCKLHFNESKNVVLTWDKDMTKDMGAFAGWNLFGVAAGIGYGQGVNVLLNIFFGASINASRGIAFQIQGAISSLITNFQLALAPVITKGYARDESKETFDLVFSSSKLSFYLLLIFAIPLLVKTNYILVWWLKIVPEYSVIFTKLIIIDLVISSLSGPLHILAQAAGKIRNYQILVSGILILNVPFSYLFLKLGYSPEITIVISIFFSLIALCARLFILHFSMQFPISQYFKKVIFKVVIVTFISWGIPYYISLYLQNDFLDFMIICLVSSITILLSVFYFGMDSLEKSFIVSKTVNILKR